VTPEEEQAGLLALEPAQRDVVLRRAVVIDRFLGLPKRSTADADVAAAELSVSRSNFYRMVERYRTAGMVGGLVPHARLRKQAFGREDDEGDWMLGVLRRELARKPDARLKDLVSAVSEHAAAIDREPPSAPAVQRRASGLRRMGEAGVSALSPTVPLRFGRELLIDRCAIEEWVAPDSGADHPRHLPGDIAREVCTFIIDRDTRLIIGAGVDPLPFATEGFEGALVEADAFWSKALIGSIIPVAPERITWVLPQGFTRMADAFVTAASEAGIQAEAIARGARRYGERLRKLIGDRIGPYRLMPRMTHDPRPSGSTPLDTDVRHPAEVGKVLGLIIDEWNLELVRLHEGAASAPDDASRQARRREWSRAERLAPSAPQWLAALLLPGRPLADLSPTWGVQALRLNDLPDREQVEQIRTRKPGWLPPVVVFGDQAPDGGTSQI
jgi:hypothetical protein